MWCFLQTGEGDTSVIPDRVKFSCSCEGKSPQQKTGNCVVFPCSFSDSSQRNSAIEKCEEMANKVMALLTGYGVDKLHIQTQLNMHMNRIPAEGLASILQSLLLLSSSIFSIQ